MSDDTDNLHDLTKLLLDRMKTYPEEFQLIGIYHTRTGDGSVRFDSRWAPDIDFIWQYGAEADKDALKRGLMDFQFRDALERLLVPEKKEESVGQSTNAAGLSGYTPGNAGNGGPGGMNVNIGPYSPRNLTPEEALAIIQAPPQPLSIPTTTAPTTFEALKRKLGL
jgi:hypothetical protein